MTFEPVLLWAVVVLPLIGFAVNGVAAFAAPDRKAIPSWTGPAVVGLAFVIAAFNMARMLGAEVVSPVVRSYWSWIPVGNLQVEAALQLDQLSLLMALIVTGVGFVIHVFSIGYMRDDPGYARYFAYLNLFVFFMLVLVLGANFPVMFVGWEGVGLSSYLLIGFWFRDREKADAGKKAFIVNRIGDTGFLIAMFLVFAAFGTLDFLAINRTAPEVLPYGGAVVTAITLFLFLGAVGKSAQIPLHVWLPDAMAGPTPVSALIHAATMVTAGVYLIVRTGVLFAMAPTTMITVAGIGALTALFAATIGLVQTDIKKVLAYSTVSQLGFMFLAVGIGAFSSGMFHLMTHAFFKALLFLGSGAVIYAMHQAFHHTHKDWDAQDMRNMGGLRHVMPITWITMWVGTLAIAGVWPFAGFFSKDEIIWQVAARAVGPFAGWFTLYWVVALSAAVLTAFYMTRLMIMTFHGRNRSGEAERPHLREAPLVMWLPLLVLAVLSLSGGWINLHAEIAALPVLGWVPGVEWLHYFLQPVTAQADAIIIAQVGTLSHAAPLGGGEGLWAYVAFAIAVVTIGVGAAVLLGREYRSAVDSPPAAGFNRILYNKWYVDELYDAIVVRPILAVSRALWRFVDAGIIDGAVNGIGHVSRALGWAGARLQTGQLNTYAFAVVIGMLILLGLVVL